MISGLCGWGASIQERLSYYNFNLLSMSWCLYILKYYFFVFLQVLATLEHLEKVSSFQEFVQIFSQFGNEMVEFAHLTGDRQNVGYKCIAIFEATDFLRCYWTFFNSQIFKVFLCNESTIKVQMIICVEFLSPLLFISCCSSAKFFAFWPNFAQPSFLTWLGPKLKNWMGIFLKEIFSIHNGSELYPCHLTGNYQIICWKPPQYILHTSEL